MIDALWWFMGTELVGTIMCGPSFLSGPVRVPTYILMRRKGYKKHKFRPHIRKDMHGPEVMNFCDVCNAYKGNWIHLRDDEGEIEVRDPEEDAIIRDNKIRSLEAQNIRWRFANDPDWVKVFGEGYDPETGDPIPQFHNGECGGPHDSCERCNWEFDQAEKEAEEKARVEEKKKAEEKAAEKQKVSKLDQEEIDGYESILWTLWNTTHEYKHAKEEWEELLDEIGMLKNDNVRVAVKKLDVFKRLHYILVSVDNGNADKYWRRREETWRVHDKNQKIRKSEADYYKKYKVGRYSNPYPRYDDWD